MTRYPSVPLVTVDPYFSVWSAADTLNSANTVHWTGVQQPILGFARIDGKDYRFLGGGQGDGLTQTNLVVTPTASAFTLQGAGIQLEARFSTPVLLTDLELVSRPCSYIDFTVTSADGKPHEVSLELAFDQAHCCAPGPRDGENPFFGGVHHTPGYQAAWMGRAVQTPLGHSGDETTIDWGYLYLALPHADGMQTQFCRENGRNLLRARMELGTVSQPVHTYAVAAYDDGIAIQYFDLPAKAYWARGGKTILTAIGEAFAEHNLLRKRCDAFDLQLQRDALAVGGEDYVRICALAYRQTVAAHKLIADGDGNPVFLSKECCSNGCIGTVDVSYPSVPLYLLYQPELVKGMLRPVFAFARMPVWEYDFAPHDVGRYPYATGQVYGLQPWAACTADGEKVQNGQVYPPYYQYPAGSAVYDLNYQMPVEECGNMLIMTAAVALLTDDTAFAAGQMDLLETWVCYLMDYGLDPGQQLCTDDFAGHLAHNVNLAAKAIMGIASYAILLELLGRTAEAEGYLHIARDYAADWQRRAQADGHTRLTFDDPHGWSLKYNLIWDILFDTRLFAEELYRQEVAWYQKVQNRYGVPLDSRKDYTKSDWILWCAAMAETTEERQALLAPMVRFLEETPDRIPFGDWYDTKSGVHYDFKNRTVQGGLYMPLLRARMRNEWRESPDGEK